MRPMWRLVAATSRVHCSAALSIAVLLLMVANLGAQLGSEGIVYDPQKPNSNWIPDPDAVRWDGRQDRPGYRYRGLLPVHERFYAYIQAKRAAGTELSWADRFMISRLQSVRRWPEPPAPTEFWRELMRCLRSLDRPLNLGEEVLVGEMISRGIWPSDNLPSETTQRLIDLLEQSGATNPRNWFERTFGRVTNWMDHLCASSGYDMRPQTPGPGVFPGEPFNGMQIRYSVSGASLEAPQDTPGFTTSRSHNGVFAGGTLTVSGSVSMSGGFGADATVALWAGGEKDEWKVYLKNPGDGSANTEGFSLSVPVAAGTDSGGFAIRMDGHYSMGGGHRGLVVTGSFGKSAAQKAAEAAEADAAWRQQVEKTLAELGYEDTPEGKAIQELREALAGGDAAWKVYVNRQLKSLGPETTPEAEQYRELRGAMRAGGPTWDQYAQEHGGGAGGVTQPPGGGQTGTAGRQPAGGEGPSLPDVGGLTVGPTVEQGKVGQPADYFEGASTVATAYSFANVPGGSTCEAVWTRDGVEVARSTRPISGDGWVAFQLNSGGPDSLAAGVYTITLSIGNQVVGRKTFTIGN